MDFTTLSAQLLNKNRTQVIAALQNEGIMVTPSSSNDQILKAYLVSIADSPDFRKNIAAIMSNSNAARNADGTTDPCDPSNTDAVNNTACPQYWAAHPMDNSTPDITNTNPTTANTNSNGGLFSSLGKVFSSQAFNTVLDTAAGYLNTQQQLKVQAANIQGKQLDLANNEILTNAGVTPAGLSKTGLSTGTKIFIFVGLIALVGGVIILLGKKKTTGGFTNAKVISSSKPVLKIGEHGSN